MSRRNIAIGAVFAAVVFAVGFFFTQSGEDSNTATATTATPNNTVTTPVSNVTSTENVDNSESNSNAGSENSGETTSTEDNE